MSDVARHVDPGRPPLYRRVRFWLKEGIRERVHYHWVRLNPWIRARQLDRERAYWKQRVEECEAQQATNNTYQNR